jgi:hypothetical protein
MYFAFDIRNSGNDQQFMIEADDLISAHMKAIEFAKKIDEKILERFRLHDTSVVSLVGEWNFLWATDASINEYLENNREYFEYIESE